MAMAMLSWMLAIPVLGMMVGLRTMTPIAIVCWFAWLGDLPVDGTWAAWSGKLISVILFSILALGEYVGDKLPRTPNRTTPGPLIARLVFGGLVGAIAATGVDGSAIEGIFLGALGALLGVVRPPRLEHRRHRGRLRHHRLRLCPRRHHRLALSSKSNSPP